VAEGWSEKYKRSINCSHPKGFSQRAHCAGKKKHNESIEMEMVCPDCGMCRTHGNGMMEVRQRLDAKCWKGKHKEGTKIKGGVRVNNCVPNEGVAEGEKHGLYYNVNKRKKAGTSRPASSPKAPTAQAWKDAAKTAKQEGVTEVSEDWQKVNKRDKTDGMSQKAVNAYRREHPGSKLKTAVTTKPSKLKRGSKASKRRSSYCSRSAGQKKMHHIDCSKTPDKAICKARRRWNCEESISEGQVKEIAIQYQDYKHLPEMAFQSRYKMSKRDWWAKHGRMVQGAGLGIGLGETHRGSKRSAAEKLKQNLKRAGYDVDERERYWRERVKKINQEIEQWNTENPENQIKKSSVNEGLLSDGYHHYETNPVTGRLEYRGIHSKSPK
jgi:hypothetical protein